MRTHLFSWLAGAIGAERRSEMFLKILRGPMQHLRRTAPVVSRSLGHNRARIESDAPQFLAPAWSRYVVGAR